MTWAPLLLRRRGSCNAVLKTEESMSDGSLHVCCGLIPTGRGGAGMGQGGAGRVCVCDFKKRQWTCMWVEEIPQSTERSTNAKGPSDE